MIQRTRRVLGKLGEDKGFTLVEMALVLIIIGIIIGAIVKGKDLVRSAEQKRVYSKFLNEWRLTYLNFYDRTGKILGDTYNTAGGAAGQDGFADTAGGDATSGDSPAELVTSTTPASWLGLTQVGLNSPVTNVPNISYQYRYVDSQGNSHVMGVTFLYSGTYNYMAITAMPNELAMAMDTMVDGEADGNNGDFRSGAGAAWGTTPTTNVAEVRWIMKF